MIGSVVRDPRSQIIMTISTVWPIISDKISQSFVAINAEIGSLWKAFCQISTTITKSPDIVLIRSGLHEQGHAQGAPGLLEKQRARERVEPKSYPLAENEEYSSRETKREPKSYPLVNADQ